MLYAILPTYLVKLVRLPRPCGARNNSVYAGYPNFFPKVRLLIDKGEYFLYTMKALSESAFILFYE